MGSISQNSTVLRLLDAIHAQDPTALYCVHPVSSDVSDGWTDISIADLVSATSRFAYWIHTKVALADGPQTLAYMGANDIRYCAFVFACMRLRHTVCSINAKLIGPSRVAKG
jgi:acyl-CoA synthetase (AMP-forming)/AMP-acid ligase II